MVTVVTVLYLYQGHLVCSPLCWDSAGVAGALGLLWDVIVLGILLYLLLFCWALLLEGRGATLISEYNLDCIAAITNNEWDYLLC